MRDVDGVRAARFLAICGLAVGGICATFPAPAALAEVGTALLLAQAYPPPPMYGGPPTGYPPPPAFVPHDVSPSRVARADLDGRTDAGAQISATAWFCAGFFLSWIGIILGYVLKPSVDGARLVGKSADYVSAYTEAYQAAGRSYQGIHAIYGCVTSGSILFGLTLALFVVALAASGISGS